jgi:hypothetical protein
MQLLLQRTEKAPNYTAGKLFINGVFECFTLEDTDRGLNYSDSKNTFENEKIEGKTAIPTGIYSIDMETQSPKYKEQNRYKEIDFKLPRLLNVPSFEGILIHIGNTTFDTFGCILVGEVQDSGKLLYSKNAFEKLYKKLFFANFQREKITISII